MGILESIIMAQGPLEHDFIYQTRRQLATNLRRTVRGPGLIEDYGDYVHDVLRPLVEGNYRGDELRRLRADLDYIASGPSLFG